MSLRTIACEAIVAGAWVCLTGCTDTSPITLPADSGDAMGVLDATANPPADAVADTPSERQDSSLVMGDADAGVGVDAAEGGPTDANPSDGADADAGPCTGTLDYVSTMYAATCPPSYAAAMSSAFACGPGLPALFAGDCGGQAAVGYWYTNHWKVCVYAGADGGGLVGAAAENDIDSFCNQTAYIITGGQVPDSCITMTSYISPLLTELDASCLETDAAADSATDGADAHTD